MESNYHKKTSLNLAQIAWDAWCCISIIGIWPRFIEHQLLNITQLSLKVPHLPTDLKGIKILQISDLHLHPKVSDKFLQKIQNSIFDCKPDLILFTGDFLCFSLLRDLERLQNFLSTIQAPYGCYAILGNHDYEQFVSVNENGEYDVLNSSTGSLGRVLKRLWTKTSLAHKRTERVKQVKNNEVLEKLLKNTSFTLLKNETVKVPIKNSFLNVTGLEEYTLGRSDPAKAFLNFDKRFPGIVMIHNPDGIPPLLDFPGEIILSGHTHGGQVNLPWLWKKFTLMENPQFKRGLVRCRDKWAYINRGVGSVMQFRWFAVPEILLLTLEPENESTN